jgi:acetyl-CoA carboxylase, biotin carboxylase subunit
MLFNKILIANRGEIAVRILRACHEMGIATLAVYQPNDRGSLHVRLADEALPLETPGGFVDQDAILRLAQSKGVDAIHPGYGFLAERAGFVRDCEAAGITFIGPPAKVVESTANKIEALEKASRAGFPTPPHSRRTFTRPDMPALFHEADALGYPLVVKSCWGGRGRGERLVWSAERLERAVSAAQTESQVVYGDRSVYLEKAVLPAHQIGVQIVADHFGRRIHLGEREGSLLYGNQKIVEEAPAPCLGDGLRQELWHAALALADLFDFENVGTVEFLLDENGRYYFSEIKPRIQIVHPLAEMVSRVDLVRQQILLAGGQPLELGQEQVHLEGWAMQCRITAEDPWRQYMPNPGMLDMVRLPSGPGVRVDTYVYCGCYIPAEYDPLVAKLVVWAPDREQCVARLRHALRECSLTGTPTNLPLVQRIIEQPEFVQGCYTTDGVLGLNAIETDGEDGLEARYRDLAAIIALAQQRQTQGQRPALPERLLGGWHRDSRRLPS